MRRETATQVADLPHDYIEVAVAGLSRCDICGGPKDEFLHGDVFAPQKASAPNHARFRVERGS